MALERITRDRMLMDIAFVVAQRGTCSRLQVGCVISRDGRIIATGYNGAPAGMPHCDHTKDPIPRVVLGENMDATEWVDKPGKIMVIPEPQMQITDMGCQVAEHAERNAIAFAARHGMALNRSEIHVTNAPCLACARTVINAGIIKVTYQVPYRLTDGIDMLIAAGVEVAHAFRGSN